MNEIVYETVDSVYLKYFILFKNGEIYAKYVFQGHSGIVFGTEYKQIKDLSDKIIREKYVGKAIFNSDVCKENDEKELLEVYRREKIFNLLNNE